MSTQSDNSIDKGSALEVFRIFAVLGLTSFGGPAAHIGFFRQALVEKRQWLSDQQFTQLLALCQFIPGPASSQLGFLLGYQRAGWTGALSAFVAFTLPSALALFLFAGWIVNADSTALQHAIHGLKLVACVVVFDAVLGMFRSLCPDAQRRTIALAAGIFLLLADSVWAQLGVVLGGAIIGVLMLQSTGKSVPMIKVGYSQRTGAVLLAIFGLLLVGLPLLAQQYGGLIAFMEAFYRAGALVFGGGHVVLPLLEASVVTPGWVSEETFLAGYGAAQAVPGPLFTFAAFLGASIDSHYSVVLVSTAALLAIFLPGFLLVAGILPFWHSVMQQPKAGALVAGVNAAVVGLLGATLYDPIVTTGIQSRIDLAIVVVGIGLLSVWKRSPLWAVAWCVLASVGLGHY